MASELSAAPVGRFYKSRKSRPCDSCRRRKVTCDMPTGPPCHRCIHKKQPCTFEQGPGPRRRRTLQSEQHGPTTSPAPEEDHAVSFLEDLMPSGAPSFETGQLASMMQDFATPDLQKLLSDANFGSADPSTPHGTWNRLPFLHGQSPGSSNATVSSMDCTPQEASIQNGMPFTTDGSLESLPGAFSFYIGPTGVSDAYLLNREDYDDKEISQPKVKGLRYRRMVAGHPPNNQNNTPQPTIFGLTDHGLLKHAEPKIDHKAAEDAWSELWKIVSPRAARQLIRLYSRFVDPYFPILSSYQIPSTVEELSNISLGLLTAICATALPFVLYDESLYQLLLHPPSTQQLYRLCWMGISQELHAPTLSTLQACLLLQQRLPTNPYLSDTAFAWTLMSTATAVAQIIGLHRDPSSWTSVPTWERKLRRRLWWALWTMEKWVALARGMPSHLKDEDFDVAPLAPSDIDNTLSSSTETQSHLYHLVLLTHILSDIQHTYYTVRAVSKTAHDLQHSLDAARTPRARLKEWLDSLPQSLQFRGRRSSCSTNTTSISDSQDPQSWADRDRQRDPRKDGSLDGNASIHLSYVVAHMTLFRALLRPLDRWPDTVLHSPLAAQSTYQGAKAVTKGALLCVKDFVEFVESLTDVQWNAFWHSWSRPNFAIAGSFIVHLLHVIGPQVASESQLNDIEAASGVRYDFSEEYQELLSWVRRWRWANRVSANGAAGMKGLTNLGLLRVEVLLGKLVPTADDDG